MAATVPRVSWRTLPRDLRALIEERVVTDEASGATDPTSVARRPRQSHEPEGGMAGLLLLRAAPRYQSEL